MQNTDEYDISVGEALDRAKKAIRWVLEENGVKKSTIQDVINVIVGLKSFSTPPVGDNYKEEINALGVDVATMLENANIKCWSDWALLLEQYDKQFECDEDE